METRDGSLRRTKPTPHGSNASLCRLDHASPTAIHAPMNRLLLVSLVAAALSSACGSTNSSSSPPGAAQLSGSVGGKPFVFRSGLWHLMANGTLDIFFSDAGMLCDAATQGKLHAGETLVQVYALNETPSGKFVAGEVKYATVAADCATGQPIQNHVDKHAMATGSEFTISTFASVIEGKLSFTFDDGSSLAGDFSVPMCGNEATETDTCF
jgi:hypothetical protein